MTARFPEIKKKRNRAAATLKAGFLQWCKLINTSSDKRRSCKYWFGPLNVFIEPSATMEPPLQCRSQSREYAPRNKIAAGKYEDIGISIATVESLKYNDHNHERRGHHSNHHNNPHDERSYDILANF